MTGKNMTCKELMQYMIAQNVKRAMTDMLREAGYEIGFDAGQVEIDGVEKMVERLVLSTSGMEKGCRKCMSKEHPYGYFYRTMCTVMARSEAEVYARDVYVAGYASKWDLSITMIWDASDRDPNYGDILWVSSEEEFDPFEDKRDKRDKIIVTETEAEQVEEQVETEETEGERKMAETMKAIEMEMETMSPEEAEHKRKAIQAYGLPETEDDWNDWEFGWVALLPEEFAGAAKEAAGKYVAEMLHKAYEYTTAVGWGSSRNVADDGDAERFNLVYVSIQGEPEVVGADVMPDAFEWMTTLPEHKMYKVLVEIRHHYDVQSKTLAVYIAADRTGTMRHSIWDAKTGKLMFWSPVWAQEYGENSPKVMPIFTAFRWREEHFEYKNYQDLFVHMDITLARKLGLLDDPEENEIDIWA